jgi:hypothetical protein
LGKQQAQGPGAAEFQEVTAGDIGYGFHSSGYFYHGKRNFTASEGLTTDLTKSLGVAARMRRFEGMFLVRDLESKAV